MSFDLKLATYFKKLKYRIRFCLMVRFKLIKRIDVIISINFLRNKAMYWRNYFGFFNGLSIRNLFLIKY